MAASSRRGCRRRSSPIRKCRSFTSEGPVSDRRRPAALEVKGLDVYYGHSHVLQGVDLTIESGVFSVVGRNGMGKSTLCKTIMGLLRPSAGVVRVRGQDVTHLNPAA